MKNTRIEAFDHVEFLKQPERWPAWPACPMRKKVPGETWPLLGIVAPNVPTVHEGLNIYMGWNSVEFDAAPKHEYESFEAMVADGWEVD